VSKAGHHHRRGGSEQRAGKSFHVEPPKTDGPRPSDLTRFGCAIYRLARRIVPCRSTPCNAGCRIRLVPMQPFPPNWLLVLSRDRLAIEVKGLTAAPVAAVNGTDLT
jgi:hypothetical protein